MRQGVLVLLSLILITTKNSYSQACCSGGAPISFNLVFNTAPTNTFQFAISYDYNNLGSLLESNDKFSDNSRIRSTNAVLLNVGYTISKRFAIDTLPVILTNEEGNDWDIFGKAVTCPRVGEQLTPLYSMVGYFFPVSSIFREANIINYRPTGG